MKGRGFTPPGYKSREWEQEREICVYATEGVALSNVEQAIDAINDAINEFNLPLDPVNGNTTKTEDIPLVEDLITSNTAVNSIDCSNILKDLLRYWEEGMLRYGLVVLVNHERYEFRNETSDTEPAIYGWTDVQGLSVVRRFDIQNTVRHEFGHMVGLGFEHHPGCVTAWDCSIYKFCKKCLRDIKEIWES